MVRRASRLPPNDKSLEEVVLQRIASGSSSASPASTERRKPSAVATATRRPTAVVVPNGNSNATSNGSTSSSATLERIESMATELSQLNDRLVTVATTTSKRKSSARSNDTDRTRVAPRDQIDAYITESMHDVYTAYATRKPDAVPTRHPHGRNGGRNGGNTAVRASVDPAHGAHVTHAVRELRSTVRRLDKVFYEVATGDRQRHLAATKIETSARGFLARRRFRKMKYALGQWRARKCFALLSFLEQFSAREEFLARQIVRLDREREVALLRRVVAELRDVTLLNLPMRRKRLDETDRRFAEKQRVLVTHVWGAWRQSALGPRSRKQVSADARARHLAARRRLEALERFDVLTPAMVHDEFLKENIRIVRARHPYWVLRTYFSVLLHDEYLPRKRQLALAIAHDRRYHLTRVWRAWLPLFRAAQVDRALARSVHERRTLDRFEKHHNLRQIDAHYRATHARKHLRAWCVYGQRIRRVRRLFEDTTKQNVAQRVARWRVRATYQRALRANAVEQWQAYGRRIFQTPFRAWYTFAAARRADRQAKESICIAYQRRARRQTKYAFFRLWKHFVLFGNVEGIHSKVHLLRSLEDQKRLCLGLEQNAVVYQQNIRALHETIRGLEGQLTSKQLELVALHDATQATRFSVHSAEQSIARVQGMLEAVRQLHPGTLARIEKMFAESPLLTQDLHDVVALHVAKRRDVLEKLALDDDELEIQAAGHPGTREDQLLLHRVKWVLSRLDLDAARDTRHTNRGGSGHGSGDSAMEQLCALFEFIRTGETTRLTTDNDPSHPRGSGHQELSQHQSSGHRVARADLLAASETWHAFLQALTVRFAPERMLSVQERLVKRADEMGEQLRELKANRHIYNAYSGSAQPPLGPDAVDSALSTLPSSADR